MPQGQERRDRVRELFHAALEHHPAHRTSVLRQACGDDQALFDEVAELVRLHGHVEADDEPQQDPLVGEVLGSYLILRLIGEGGMGRVYLARRADGAYDRQVAVKVLPGSETRTELRARFEQERRFLASLHHPSIAEVLDAGYAADGSPYLVMEYVDGLPITQFCMQRSLTLIDRLKVFLEVCEAVSEAHRQLIVHRDIKPGNILVDASGRPKLVDFGIAKLVTPAGLEASDPTAPHLRRATPAYASPEQLQGEAAHTGMDVYALGVVLHEIMTGSRPSRIPPDATTTSELAGFQKPSAALAQTRPGGSASNGTHSVDPDVVRPPDLVGDLDAIILKALDVHPGRRYRSVEALSQDLRAYLGQRPVTARAASRGHVLWLWVRRNQVTAAAMAIAVTALISAAASLAVLWWRTSAERDRLTTQLDAAQTLSSEVFALDESLANLPMATESRRRMVTALSAYLDALSQHGESPLTPRVAEGYRRLGDLLGNPNGPNLGEPARALESYRAALRLLEPETAALAATRASLLLKARIRAGMGDVLLGSGNHEAAEEEFLAAKTLIDRQLVADPDDPEARAILAGLWRPIGDVRRARGDVAAALAAYEEALVIDRAHIRRDPGNPAYRRGLALSLVRIADVHAQNGSLDLAEEHLKDAAAALESLAGAAGQNLSLRRDMAVNRLRLAGVLSALGDDRAGAEADAALAEFRELAGSDPANDRARRDLMAALVQWADLMRKADVPAAGTAYREARNLAATAGPGDPSASQAVETIDRRLTELAEGHRPAELRLFIVSADGRRPLRAGAVPPAEQTRILAAPVVSPAWSRYLLVFGAEGPAELLDDTRIGPAGWNLPADGPPPTQTILLVTTRTPLSADEQRSLVADVTAIAGPRTVDWDSHIVWRLGEPSVESAATARGNRLQPWVEEVRSRLAKIGGVDVAGRTFPLTPVR